MAWFRHTVESGGQAIDHVSPPQSSQRTLKAITISWGIAPVTAGDLVVSLDSQLGAAWDTEIYRIDPSDDGLTAVLLTDVNLPVFVGDKLTVAYANPDGRTIGIQIILSN